MPVADDSRASRPRPGGALVRHDDGGPVWYEARGDGWRAAFSTRLGGVSPAPFDTLNLGIATADDPARVWRNRLAFAAAAGIAADDLVVPGQVHGTTVAEVGGRSAVAAPGLAPTSSPSTDGLLTREAGVPLFVSFADCVPVLLSPAGRRAPWRWCTPAGAAWWPASSPGGAGGRRRRRAGCRRHRPEHRALLLCRLARRRRTLRGSLSRHVAGAGMSICGKPPAANSRPAASRRPTSSRADCARSTTRSSSRTVANTGRPAGRRLSPGSQEGCK